MFVLRSNSLNILRFVICLTLPLSDPHFPVSLKMIKVVLLLTLVLVAMSSTFGKYIPKGGKRIPQTLSRGL